MILFWGVSWFDFIQKRLLEAQVTRVDCMVFIPMKRERGRPRKTLGEIVNRSLMVKIL